jgi:uncharacterized protein
MSSSTRDTLTAAMKTALQQGEKEKLAVVRMLFTEIRNAEINDPTQPGRMRTEEEAVALVAAYHKNLSKTLAEYPPDRQEPLRKELAIVEQFLPKRLSAPELEQEIAASLKETSERNFGLLMKSLSPKFNGRADGKLISETLKALLSKA